MHSNLHNSKDWETLLKQGDTPPELKQKKEWLKFKND